jgi:predicted nucleotide-binding protein
VELTDEDHREQVLNFLYERRGNIVQTAELTRELSMTAHQVGAATEYLVDRGFASGTFLQAQNIDYPIFHGKITTSGIDLVEERRTREDSALFARNPLAAFTQLRSDVALLMANAPASIRKAQEFGELYIRRQFGDRSRYLGKWQNIQWTPLRIGAEPSQQERIHTLSDAREEALALIDVMIADARESKSNASMPDASVKPNNRKVFVVHGHDTSMRNAVTAFLHQLELEPIVLEDKAYAGRTTIEKFEQHSDVSFAVALFSPDDEGRAVRDRPASLKLRPRMNVILELGFFFGKLGRGRAFALVAQHPPIESPSNLAGVGTIPFDDQGTWKQLLFRELLVAGFDLNPRRL